MTKKMFLSKKATLSVLFFSFMFALLLAAVEAQAQEKLDFSSSLNPVGSGARATGMGGAFIGVADDATAASWNPAGLVQLEKPEVSLVYTNASREQTYSSLNHPESVVSNTMGDLSINYLSAVFDPVALGGHTTVFSLNYQRLYEMGKTLSLPYNYEVASPDALPFNFTLSQTGHLYALSPAVAIQITPVLSLGLTVNFWKDHLGANGWEKTTRISGSGTFGGGIPYTADVVERQTVEFGGRNAHIGALWNAVPKVTVGAVIKTPFDAKLTKTIAKTDQSTAGGAPVAAPVYTETKEDQTMRMPLSYGTGVQYRPADQLVLALDVYKTAWSRVFVRDAQGVETNALTGNPLSDGRLKDTTQVRAGAEYLFIGSNRTIALRGGVFTDPEPAVGRIDRYRGFSLGTGYTTKQFSLDASYQHRKGTGVTSDAPFISDSTMDVTQQTVMVSGIYYFK